MFDSSHHTALAQGGEFDIIRELLNEWGDVAEGVGDDAAMLDVPRGHQLLVSTDATVEDVHFRRKWMTASDVGYRSGTAALSDLAAMGGQAHSVLVSLIVPTVWREHLHDFAAGLKISVQGAGARIVGGNISRGATFSCTLTVLGTAIRPVRRSGAQAGDALFVTGVLGGPAAAVAAWEHNDVPNPLAVERFLHPVARLREGQWLAGKGATAMIDISDGLLADARHVAAASGVHCAIDVRLIPVVDGIEREDAARGGEEYELLVAIPAQRAVGISAAFVAAFGIGLTQIGWVSDRAVAGSGNSERVVTDAAGAVELRDGHDHFSA